MFWDDKMFTKLFNFRIAQSTSTQAPKTDTATTFGLPCQLQFGITIETIFCCTIKYCPNTKKFCQVLEHRWKSSGGDILFLPCPSVRPSVCHTSFPLNNSSTLWPRAFNLHSVIALIKLKTPIDFGVSRTKVKVTVTQRVKTVSAQ